MHKPDWDLTCYGINVSWEHGRNIIQGEFSFEELRVEAYGQYLLNGNISQMVESLMRMKAERSILIRQILSDLPGTIRHARQPLLLPAAPQITPTQAAPLYNQPQVPVVPLPVPMAVQTPTVSVPPSNPPMHLGQPTSSQVERSTAERPVFSFGKIPELPPM